MPLETDGVTSPQSNPLLSFPDSILDDEDEEMISMATGGDDEEGVIRDHATEVMEVTEKVKVHFQWYCYGL